MLFFKSKSVAYKAWAERNIADFSDRGDRTCSINKDCHNRKWRDYILFFFETQSIFLWPVKRLSHTDITDVTFFILSISLVTDPNNKSSKLIIIIRNFSLILMNWYFLF